MQVVRPRTLMLLLLASFGTLHAEETSLTIRWELGERFGGVTEDHYTTGTGDLRSWPDYANGARMSYQAPSASWYLRFGAADRQRLVPGRYSSSPSGSNLPADAGDMFVSGWGQRCNMGQQWFDVREIEYGAGGEATRFWIVFESHCLGQEGSLMGDVRYNVDLPVSLMAPLVRGVQKLDSLSFEVRGSSELSTPASLAAEELPAGARFTDREDGTGFFSWQTGFDQVGTHEVTFTATDSLGRVDRFSTAIVVGQGTSS